MRRTQGTRGVVLPLPAALRQRGDGESADARSIGASALVTGEAGAEDSVLVRWELAPRLGAGQLLLLAGVHASVAALEKEVRCQTGSGHISVHCDGLF